jgi:DNA repair protein SbcD/Mre11
MKFAHLADCHIGSWYEPRLRKINQEYFEKAINIIIQEKTDFLIISGDLFNSAIPSIDDIKNTIKQLKLLKEENIPVYIIAGSHDFSPSGKTMLDVIEQAGFAISVSKGGEEITINERNLLKLKMHHDKKTGAYITGLPGKKGGLEKNYYQNLYTEHFKDFQGYKIFMFHSALNEIKPKELSNMESFPISMLPKGFDYYAGGHVHIFEKQKLDNYNIAYPGPIFPNNFYELEKLKKGTFLITENNQTKLIELNDFPVHSINIDCNKKKPSEIEEELKKEILEQNFAKKIITIRLKGELNTGKPKDINLNEIFEKIKKSGAEAIIKNTRELNAKGFQITKEKLKNIEEAETEIIEQHTKENTLNNETTKALINALSSEKKEGEKNLDYEKRIFTEVENILKT